MPSQKLILILKTLDNQDWREFDRYVRSPFFNRNERLVKLVDLLRKHAPDFKESVLTKEKLFEAMYGKRTEFKEQQVYDHIAFLMRLLEGYLSYRQFQEDEAMESRYLLNAFVFRNLPEHFERAFKKQKRSQEKKTYRNPSYHLSRFFAEREANQLAVLAHRPDYVQITERMVDHLDQFFIASRLQHGCSKLIYQEVWNTQIDTSFLENILAFLEAEGKGYLEFPEIGVYYHIFKMLSSETATELHYEAFKNLIGKYSARFSSEENYVLYGYAQNYVTSQLNAGKSEYIKELFRIYQEILQKEVFLINGYLDAGAYKNMVTVGLRLSEYDWVANFLDQYREYLHPSHQNAAYHYNVGQYHYAKGDYSKALRELLQTELMDVDYHLNVRHMQLKIYFEQEEDEALYSLMDAFSSYLKRNRQVSDNKLQAYRTLVRFIRKAARLRQHSYTYKEETFNRQKAALLEELKNVPNLPNRSWLIERVETIEGN
ncbi:MAG: hypothetical protein AB8F95_10340 [Bacteroidia bacterium]